MSARRPEFGLANQPALSARFSGVAALDVFARPSAVGRFVIAVVVDAIERRFWRSYSHVGKKVVEQFPRIAEGDASSSVVFKSDDIGIGAALDHATPRLISPREAALPRMGVPKPWWVVALDAAAAVCFAFDSTSSGDRDFRSTITAKNPAGMFASDVRKSKCGQTTEAGSSMIAASGHV